MKKEHPKVYEPGKYEDKIYEKWEKSGYFNPDNLGCKNKADTYSISMPPPNRTGTLHMGHAVMLAIQDILIRYHRMKGDKTLWVPGTDHAAIATQTKVEKILKEEGTDRHKLGREKFLKRVVEFAQDSHNTIVNQIKKIGSSCDWSREAYTLDETRNKVVNTVFKMMYDDGLIYRGERIVNWCPRCHSTLADDEVEYKAQKTKLYTFKYSKNFPFAIATTRPETKLGDTAVAVNPKDKRYKKYIGKIYQVDFVGVKLKLKVIVDRNTDIKFGTGALGVTPAHSIVDWQLAEENNLDIIKVIDEDGKIRDGFGKYSGQDVIRAREMVAKELQKKGLLIKEEEIENNLSLCYRCDTPIEPLPSLQWFIDVNKKIPKYKKSIKELSVEAVRKGVFNRKKINIIPERFEKNYFHWMDNLRDWCISRQIWFGHRIPVWHKTEIGSNMEAVSFKSSVLCEKLGLTDEKAFDRFSDDILKESSWEDKNIQWFSNQKGNIQLYIGYINLLKQKKMVDDAWVEQNRLRKPLRDAKIHIGDKPPAKIGWYQDPDTLDTWFSSGLWTFSTLAKSPEQIKIKNGKLEIDSADFKNFHPTNVLETGYDILFFWIARMIIMTIYAIGDIPFQDVYLHGLVRDEKGKKMSKTLGNTIDPLEMIKKYGADATRLSLVIGTTPGGDMNLSEAKIAGFRNFANKLWNISRYIIMNYELGIKNYEFNLKDLTLFDKWILFEIRSLIMAIGDDLENYRFSQAGERLREFTWNKLADWYLEVSKFEKNNSKYKIFSIILNDLLKLWHPFMPFVTEAIWKEMGNRNLLLVEKYPELDKYKEIFKDFSKGFHYMETVTLQKIIVAIRNARAENKVKPGKKIKAVIYTKIEEYKKLIDKQKDLIMGLRTGISELEVKIDGEKIPGAITILIADIEIYLLEAIDKKKEKIRIRKEIINLEKVIKSVELKLRNKEFIKKAPAKIVEQERKKLKNYQEELNKLNIQISNLK
ncbi:MAG: valine--tRNA ligase [Patescibacteria group bacterium]